MLHRHCNRHSPLHFTTVPLHRDGLSSANVIFFCIAKFLILKWMFVVRVFHLDLRSYYNNLNGIKVSTDQFACRLHNLLTDYLLMYLS